METKDGEPTLGDGEYSVRFLSESDAEKWVEDHNPHIGGTLEWSLWTAGFYMDQSAAVSDPKRSSWARVNRGLLWGQIILMGVVVVIIGSMIWDNAHG